MAKSILHKLVKRTGLHSFLIYGYDERLEQLRIVNLVQDQHLCQYQLWWPGRDGKSVKNSTDEYFSQKNSTKTACNSRQNNVNSLELNQVPKSTVTVPLAH